MIPGSNLMYGCPNCGRKIIVGSLISGNTLGATFFSDGTMSAPMFTEYPQEAKCKRCGTFFDFNKETFIKKLWKSLSNESDYDNAKFLSIEEYGEKIHLKQGNETANRLLMWRTANKNIDGTDIVLYNENCKHLIKILKDVQEDDFKITLAELYRNIGAFNECKAIIVSLGNNYDWLKAAFAKQCAIGNTKTFILPKA